MAEVRKNHQWEMESRAVCLVEIDKLKRELAAVTAERDALLAGKWAGPWERVGARPDGKQPMGWVRLDSGGRHVCDVYRVGGDWRWQSRDIYWSRCGDRIGGQAQADAALVAAGWYLAPGRPAMATRAES